jgi:NAD(P)-dependent dehydrogenase (short-subunit alcohol dehydrogenase family)
VATSADATQARAHVAALVILDLVLPEVSGFELLGESRASPRTADILGFDAQPEPGVIAKIARPYVFESRAANGYLVSAANNTPRRFMVPLATMVRSRFITAHAAARHMIKQHSGLIIFVTDSPARVTAIGAAFGAIENLTPNLAFEVSPSGVRVVCLRTLANTDSRSISGHDGLFSWPTEHHEGPADSADRAVLLAQGSRDCAGHRERSRTDRI